MALIEKLKAIAAAIRSKTNKYDKLTLDQMPEEILNIKSDILLQDKWIVVNKNGTQVITADFGYDGLGKINITTKVSDSNTQMGFPYSFPITF